MPAPHAPMRNALQAGIEQLVDDSRSLWMPSRIKQYTTPTTALQFHRHHVAPSVPCVWRGAAKHWPAFTKWPSPQYLIAKLGTQQLQVAWTPDGRADALIQHNHQWIFAQPEQRQQTIASLLTALHTDPSVADHHPPGVPYYSAQDSCLTRDAAALSADVPSSGPAFAAEALGTLQAANVWIGDARSVTTTHADPFENVYAVITGVKEVRLRPPCDAAVVPRRSAQRARWKSGVDVAHDQFEGWELVHEEGVVKWVDENAVEDTLSELVVVLRPGDVLYLPALWYHRVSQRGVTIAVNWWFDMVFGRDWIYRELCFHIRDAMAADKAGEDGQGL